MPQTVVTTGKKQERVVEAVTPPRDLAAFAERLRHPATGSSALPAGFFEPGIPIHVARAPGRLDVMGGIADYSGSLVLEMPLVEATCAAVQLKEGRDVEVISLPHGDRAEALSYRTRLDSLVEGTTARPYEEIRSSFPFEGVDHWAAYAVGAIPVLVNRAGIAFRRGCRILVDSSVPESKGVASSAALEVAVMRALLSAHLRDCDPVELGIWCQEVENQVAGAPCGVMDQLTASCGHEGRLLALRCQPAELESSVLLPDGISVWGLDSGEQHAVAGADYGTVRTGAFMGYRMLADHAGLVVRRVGAGKVHIEDPKWNGYLANIGPRTFERRLRHLLPERMQGADFLRQYEGITDSVTRVDPGRTYAVRLPTAHPVFEHARTERFRELLRMNSTLPEILTELGALMYAAHDSYGACGLGSPGTDLLVKMVAAAGPEAGLFGAKITGGGSGGTVAVLGTARGAGAVDAIRHAYEAETGHAPYRFAGSSPGASHAPVLVVG